MLPQFFNESMQGAPASNLASQGNTIAILDACLVNGFNSQTGLSLARTGSLVTVTKTGHGYIDWQLVTIAGATQTEYNGVFRVRRLNANSFTYNLAAGLTPATPATGTITGLTTPLGWAKVFFATNKAVYRAPSGTTRHYIRFDATNTSTDETLWCEVFKSMTSVTAGTDPYPTTTRGGSGVAGDRARHMKPHTKNASTDMGWALVGDDRRFVWLPAFNATRRTPLWFGEFKSLLPADVNNSLVAGNQFMSGANTDNVSALYDNNIAFPYSADNTSPNDAGTLSIPPWSMCVAGNPSNTIKSIKPMPSTFVNGVGASGDGLLGNAFVDPYSGNDAVLGSPLILEQPVSTTSVLALRGKLPFVLQTAHKVDTFTLGGVEKMVVSQNVPYYAQVLNVSWVHNGSSDASTLQSYAFPLGDWELL
jgi:hypothetical protein